MAPAGGWRTRTRTRPRALSLALLLETLGTVIGTVPTCGPGFLQLPSSSEMEPTCYLAGRQNSSSSLHPLHPQGLVRLPSGGHSSSAGQKAARRRCPPPRPHHGGHGSGRLPQLVEVFSLPADLGAHVRRCFLGLQKLFPPSSYSNHWAENTSLLDF